MSSNRFIKIYKQKDRDYLVNVIENPEKYQDEAVEAAAILLGLEVHDPVNISDDPVNISDDPVNISDNNFSKPVKHSYLQRIDKEDFLNLFLITSLTVLLLTIRISPLFEGLEWKASWVLWFGILPAMIFLSGVLYLFQHKGQPQYFNINLLIHMVVQGVLIAILWSLLRLSLDDFSFRWGVGVIIGSLFIIPVYASLIYLPLSYLKSYFK